MYFVQREQQLSIVWKSNCFRVKECDQIASGRNARTRNSLFPFFFFRANSNGAEFNQIRTFESNAEEFERHGFFIPGPNFPSFLFVQFLRVPFLRSIVTKNDGQQT